MSDINKPEEAKRQARTVWELHRDALDTQSDYFAVIMEFVGDERVDFSVRMEYFSLAQKALQKAIDKSKVDHDTPSA